MGEILSKKEKLVLGILMLNSKLSINKISKLLNSDKVTISNIIKKLIAKGVIKSFQVNVDLSLLGFKEFNIFVNLKKINPEIIDEFIKKLEKNEYVTWIGRCFGKFDFKISIIVRENSDLNNFINFYNINFFNITNNFEVLDVNYKFKSPKENTMKNLLELTTEEINFLNSIKFKKLNKEKSIKDKKKNLNSIKKDFLIESEEKLKILFNYSNFYKIKSVVDLSRELSMSSELFLYWIKNFENSGFIKGYSIVVNGNKLNKIWCLVLIKYNFLKLNDVEKYLQNNENISSYTIGKGIFNMTITFFAKNIEDLYSSLNSFRNLYSENIFNFEYLIFFDFYKFPKLPEIILK